MGERARAETGRCWNGRSIPASGTNWAPGPFKPRAYVERLEAEVLDTLADYGGQQALDMEGGYRVSPEQLRGLEINPRAAKIADVVLWIGYLQWHIQTHGGLNRTDASCYQPNSASNPHFAAKRFNSFSLLLLLM